MWYREHSIIIKTTKDCIWPLLTQPELWPSYDKTVSESALHGEIAVGVSGKMKKVSGDVVDFTVTELVENERIVIQVKKLGARVITIYMLDDAEEGVKVTSRIELRGLFSWFHRSTVRNSIGNTLESVLDGLSSAALARAAEQSPAEQTSGEESEASEEQEPLLDQDAVTVEGDPLENEKRRKEMHDQIEEAAQAEVPEIQKPEEELAKESTAKDKDVSEEVTEGEPSLDENPLNNAPDMKEEGGAKDSDEADTASVPSDQNIIDSQTQDKDENQAESESKQEEAQEK